MKQPPEMWRCSATRVLLQKLYNINILNNYFQIFHIWRIVTNYPEDQINTQKQMPPSSKKNYSCGNQLIPPYGGRLTVYITDLFKAILQLKQTTDKKKNKPSTF